MEPITIGITEGVPAGLLAKPLQASLPQGTTMGASTSGFGSHRGSYGAARGARGAPAASGQILVAATWG